MKTLANDLQPGESQHIFSCIKVWTLNVASFSADHLYFNVEFKFCGAKLFRSFIGFLDSKTKYYSKLTPPSFFISSHPSSHPHTLDRSLFDSFPTIFVFYQQISAHLSSISILSPVGSACLNQLNMAHFTTSDTRSKPMGYLFSKIFQLYSGEIFWNIWNIWCIIVRLIKRLPKLYLNIIMSEYFWYHTPT